MAEEPGEPTGTPASASEQDAPSQPVAETRVGPPKNSTGNDMLPENIAEQVRQTIRDAHELLEFAVADGLSVGNTIVEEIQKALCFLDAARPLTWQNCTAFEKAYRELAHTLSPLTIEAVRREALPWWKRNGGGVALTSLLLAYPLFLLGRMICEGWREWLNCNLCNPLIMGIGTVAVGSLFVIFLWWGAELFSGAVTNRKLNQLIRFCYGFTFFAITFSALPFLSIAFFPELPRILTLSPINVLQGCADPWPADGPSNPSEIPKEIRCVTKESSANLFSYQWLFNIGGEVVSVHSDQKREGNVKDKACSVYNDAFREDRWRIQGGLAVPLYVIVLALMGSAVSMTRKVPEYQRDAFGLHETLSNARARENLVFQIMQVFSAPLIVMAAYYLLAPDTRTTSVLVGFASGFASEPILLAIRGLADKLKPAENITLVSVSVDPSFVTLQAGQSQLFTATVVNSTNVTVTWSTDPPNIGTLTQTGLYTAPATITEKQIITILAISAADSTKRGSATVSLIP